ncbi:DUF4145 domain-containing protein [Hymenobacter sp. 5317J-9]|uniref:DUF4145 domain-containing protein n=1 Tax=Hymenobacter sp. 5317J-9 TaxID=2932250 RepID=UPI001FD683BD|nr:DUF4145 domain-containing protein [Hymenobacter sp. 5317J-9]UOQ96168.1 DUF4145 domain-containing protein [Hymenobacter sp. 5317J-9]
MEITTNSGRAEINGLPNHCPFCHYLIRPIPLYGLNIGQNQQLDVFMACPNSICKKGFIAYYNYNYINNDYNYSGGMTSGNIIRKEIPTSVSGISTQFGVIYNQAFAAEQQSLFEICGVGYRKALEFLIKDYAIEKEPSKQETIEKKALMACINEYVNDTRIKLVATRAVWLGNDETHYVRKWEGKNLDDLKRLIDLTMHWIEMEKLTEGFGVDMPESKK